MKIHVSLRIFWLALVVFFSALALLIWVWLIPYGILEYNLGVNLFTSSIFMVLTIVFLYVLLNAREESEWKAVKDYVKMGIQEELGALFNEMLNYVENGLAIKFSLMSSQDRKTANETALSELQKLKDAKELKLLEKELAILLGRESELKAFSEISKNLNEVQIKYSRFLLPQLVLSLMKIRDSIRLLEYTAQMQGIEKNLSTFPDTPMLVKDEIPKMTSALIPKIVAISFKNMIGEIDNIHKMGIEFSPRLI